MIESQPSMCRMCSAQCGVSVVIEAGRVAMVRGDRMHPMSQGFACAKGLQASEVMYSPDRILKPLKRTAAGFVQISIEQAVDEIAQAVADIVGESGADAIAAFKGTQTYQNATASEILPAWIRALGSNGFYTTTTIDQSSHMVTMARMGRWDAGKPGLEQSDVVLLIGTNPFVSIAGYGLLDYDPVKRLKRARERGLKAIVIDPRRTETAGHADCFLQCSPGQDAVIVAALIHTILLNGWEDHRFCDRFADGLEALRDAVAQFSPEAVSHRAGLAAADIKTAAAMFARDAKRGIAILGTGATMAPHSNLTDHLVETLNVICGRLLRGGELVPNPGVLQAPRVFREAVVPPDRCWEHGAKTSTGHGALFGERMSGILADEMLSTSDSRIRALFVQGANPAVSLPDQDKAIAGLQALDLLVSVEPFMTATAKLSHYIIPPKMLYERTDVAKPRALEGFLGGPAFNQYLPALVAPPAGADVIDDWYFYWALAKRLGLTLILGGVEVDVQGEVPTTDELLDLILSGSRVPLDELRRFSHGQIFDTAEIRVESATPTDTARFQLAPPDVLSELNFLADTTSSTAGANESFPFLLIVRRVRSTMNSFGRTFADARRRGTVNPLHMHSDDLKDLGLQSGDPVRICSSRAQVDASVVEDSTLRRGVVSMTHCWGELPGDSYGEFGVATSRFVRTDIGVETINAMPTMSSIPIRIAGLKAESSADK